MYHLLVQKDKENTAIDLTLKATLHDNTDFSVVSLN